jgi:hypothetical protein
MNVLKQHFPNVVDEDVNPFRKNRLNVAIDIAAAVRFTDIDYRQHHKFSTPRYFQAWFDSGLIYALVEDEGPTIFSSETADDFSAGSYKIVVKASQLSSFLSFLFNGLCAGLYDFANYWSRYALSDVTYCWAGIPITHLSPAKSRRFVNVFYACSCRVEAFPR